MGIEEHLLVIEQITILSTFHLRETRREGLNWWVIGMSVSQPKKLTLLSWRRLPIK